MHLAGTDVLRTTRVIAHRLAVVSACCVKFVAESDRAHFVIVYILNARIGTCLFSHWLCRCRRRTHFLMDIILMTCSCRYLMPFSLVLIFGRTIIYFIHILKMFSFFLILFRFARFKSTKRVEQMCGETSSMKSFAIEGTADIGI